MNAPQKIRRFIECRAGGIAVATAIALPVLFGIAAFGVEISGWYYKQRAMQGAVAPGCAAYFGEFRQLADSIRDAVIAADEAARRADVYPGTRRDVLRHWRLDGWSK